MSERCAKFKYSLYHLYQIVYDAIVSVLYNKCQVYDALRCAEILFLIERICLNNYADEQQI